MQASGGGGDGSMAASASGGDHARGLSRTAAQKK
jgi:hypothetical protein